MTLQLRLTIWYTALLGVTLIFFSLLVYYFLSANLYTKVRLDAEEQAPAIAKFIQDQLTASSSFSTLVPSSTPQGDISFTLQFIEIPNINVFVGIGDVQFFDIETGRILRSTNKLFNHPVSIRSNTLETVSQGELEYVRRFMHKGVPLSSFSFPLTVQDGDRIVGIQILQSIGPIEDTLAQIRRLLISGTILSLVAAALVGAYLASRSLRPLKTITETASGITQMGDLGQRLAIPDQASEVGQLADTFNQMLNRIQNLFHTQERLIADVSHELRTPLTTIQGNVDLLQRFVARQATTKQSAPDDETGNIGVHSSSLEGDDSSIKSGLIANQEDTIIEMLAEVEDEANRMGRMISDLLLLAQADSGQLTLQKEPVEMDTLLLDVYRQTQRLADRDKGPGGLTIQLGREDQAMVLGDRERLRQLLLNLAGNAIKYTPRGGTITFSLETVSSEAANPELNGAATIISSDSIFREPNNHQSTGNGTSSSGLVYLEELEAEDKDWVLLKVRDTGIGISEDSLPYVFERFYRTDKARSREMGGSGLGLSISQWIANEHGGKITASSKLQHGSEFTLWLPLHTNVLHPNA